MDIKSILDSLNLDLSNPEVRQGALEAIQAILTSREPPSSFGGGMGKADSDVEEVEVDPNLIQPSQKYRPDNDIDLEIDDEEGILDQVRQNSSETSYDELDTETDQDASNSTDSDETENTSDDTSSNTSDSTDKTNTDTENSEEADEGSSDDIEDGESSEATDSDEESNNESDDKSGDDSEYSSDADDTNDTEAENEVTDETDIDEDDLFDDNLQDVFKDTEIDAKHNSRRIKKERALSAAKKALADAKARNVAPVLIQELESAIDALEKLQEAATKTLKDLSDEEFNLVINRVFDAISAVGDTSLTYKTDAERELQVKEIKDDLANVDTQRELSAEDAAQIRAETQEIKARDKEADKYKKRSNGSFKGFSEFLNSLYRAIALQVHNNEVDNSTWSAINRRYSGTNVLKQGQRKEELPDKKIPIIDFYFDCSASWTLRDIDIGKKAVNALAEMEEDGQIKVNIYYFSDDVYNDYQSARDHGSTSGWNEIVKNVIKTQANNVIIMTDEDMDNWWKGDSPMRYTVPGYVWYLWRDGENAPRLPRDLKGRGGTQQFSFSASDA